VKADTTFRTSIEEAALVTRAVQHLRHVEHFNAHALAATPEERLTAARDVLLCERVLRGLGVEPDELTVRPDRDDPALAG
jgi:hypothetical protein